MTAIDATDDKMFTMKIQAFIKMTPFDKVKNQLIVKIKEIYLPEQSSLAGVINKASKLDFTGGDD